VRFAAHLLAGHYTIAVSVTDATGRETWAVAADAARFACDRRPAVPGSSTSAGPTSVTEGPVRRLGDATTTGPIPLARIERRRRSGA
jgi:hypothetical protein